jgi:hypothetical protein
VLVIRIINCINITSGMFRSMSVTVSCAGRKDRNIPEVILIQLILLMMSTRLHETRRECQPLSVM